MSDQEWTIQYIPVDHLVPHEESQEIFGDLQGEEYEQLKANIKEIGIRVPLEVRQIGEERYQIINGHQRYRAAKELEFQTIPAIVIEADDDTALERLISDNLHRRHLTNTQKARAGMVLEQIYARRAKARHGTPKDSGEIPKEEYGTTRDQVAKVVGLGSGKSYDREKAILVELKPETVASYENGALKQKVALALTKIKAPEVRRDLEERIKNKELTGKALTEAIRLAQGGKPKPAEANKPPESEKKKAAPKGDPALDSLPLSQRLDDIVRWVIHGARGGMTEGDIVAGALERLFALPELRDHQE